MVAVVRGGAIPAVATYAAPAYAAAPVVKTVNNYFLFTYFLNLAPF